MKRSPKTLHLKEGILGARKDCSGRMFGCLPFGMLWIYCLVLQKQQQPPHTHRVIYLGAAETPQQLRACSAPTKDPSSYTR